MLGYEATYLGLAKLGYTSLTQSATGVCQQVDGLATCLAADNEMR